MFGCVFVVCFCVCAVVIELNCAFVLCVDPIMLYTFVRFVLCCLLVRLVVCVCVMLYARSVLCMRGCVVSLV